MSMARNKKKHITRVVHGRSFSNGGGVSGCTYVVINAGFGAVLIGPLEQWVVPSIRDVIGRATAGLGGGGVTRESGCGEIDALGSRGYFIQCVSGPCAKQYSVLEIGWAEGRGRCRKASSIPVGMELTNGYIGRCDACSLLWTGCQHS